MIDWRDIRFIFQIPLDWFRKIHNRVFKAYGSNLIDVKEGDQGGMEIGIDDDQFRKEVAEIAEQAGGGQITGQIDFISSVTWNGTQIVVGHSTAKVVNKAFAITAGQNTVIDTVTYNPN